MSRMDQGLAFMLQYENIAWYENGKVRILDRRIYPREVKFVECSDYHEVRQAITDILLCEWLGSSGAELYRYAKRSF